MGPKSNIVGAVPALPCAMIFRGQDAIMVPGQVIAADTIGFMRKLDVKEIHGYNDTRGLKLSAIGAKRQGGKAEPASAPPTKAKSIRI